jgi:putative DNA methylase
VDLFNHYLIAPNAYPERKPEVQILCPRCGDIFRSLNSARSVSCLCCGLSFDPRAGSAIGPKAVCRTWSHSFPILEALRSSGEPPRHRFYAKLLLTPDGQKRYLPATQADVTAARECSIILNDELDRKSIRLPRTMLKDGYSTRQAMAYLYRGWRDFFHDRQILSSAETQPRTSAEGACGAA